MMKKEVFSQTEKHERITIRRRLFQRDVVCEKCGNRIGALSVQELVDLLGEIGSAKRQRLQKLLGEGRIESE